MLTADLPLVIILMGPPGAGKGTHAGPLSLHLRLPHISTGDLFRENIRNETALGKKAKAFIDLGQLVPDEVVLEMLFERIESDDCKNGYILDGFPRTLPQAISLDERLRNNSRILVLNFDLDDASILQRLTGRLACKGCGKPYHKLYDVPRVPGICNECRGTLYQRDDDREEIILKRLVVYRRETRPLLEHYRNLSKIIDSSKSKLEVLTEVLAAMPPHFAIR